MVLHPDIARWIVVAEQERLAELARKVPPRSATGRRQRHRTDGEAA